MSRTRLLVAPALAGALLLALSACDDGDYADRPDAYGANGYCYYVDSPAEAVALQQGGLCPVNWTPMPMPVAWHDHYSWYYSSSTYYGRYVPAASRKTYVTHITVYNTQHKTTVVTRAPKKTVVASGNYAAGNERPGGDTETSAKASPKSTYRPSGNQPSVHVRSSGSTFRSGGRR